MTTLQIVMGVVLFVLSIAIIIIVLLQEGREANLSGAIAGGGGSDTYFGKHKGRTNEAKLVRITKWISYVFLGLTLAATLTFYFVK